MSYGHLAEGDGTAHSANGIRGSGLRREGGLGGDTTKQDGRSDIYSVSQRAQQHRTMTNRRETAGRQASEVCGLRTRPRTGLTHIPIPFLDQYLST